MEYRSITTSLIAFSVIGLSVSIQANEVPVFQADLTKGIELTYGSGEPLFQRASDQYVLDWDGVYLHNSNNDFGIQGGRRVKNIFLNSGNSALWNIYDPVSFVTNISVNYNFSNVSGVNISTNIADGPYFYSISYVSPGTIFSSRITIKNNTTTKLWNNQGRTFGSSIGSESNTTKLIPDGDNWIINTQTLRNFESHLGHSLRLYSKDNIAGDIDAIQPQFEDVTGFKAGKEFSSEYVVSGSMPGIQWFDTEKGTIRSNSGTIYGEVKNVVTYGGVISESVGAVLNDIKGYYSEPRSENLNTNWNTLGNVGVAVLDGVSSLTGGPFVPALSGAKSIYIDPRSGRYINKKADITFNSGVPDTITSSSTNFIDAGFRPGMAIWTWHDTSENSNYSVHHIEAVSSYTITLTTSKLLSDSTAGLDHNLASIIRVPADGNSILIGMNTDDFHRSVVVGDTILPPYNNTALVDHDSLMVSISDALSFDGGYSGTNNNKPVYYWDSSDIGIEVTKGSGTYTIANDFSGLVSGGYGFLCRSGLVVELDNRSSAATSTYAFPGLNVTGGSVYTLSSVVKADAESSAYIQLSNHPESLVFSNNTWQRHSLVSTALFDGAYKMAITVNSGGRVWVILNQLEEGYAATSPIVTRGSSVVREATLLQYNPLNIPRNDIQGSFDWTPASSAQAKKQVLWSIYNDANNYLEFSLNEEVLTFRKRISGINYDSTNTIASTPGNTYSVTWGMNSSSGFWVNVDGVDGQPHADNSDILITGLSLFEIGSINNTFQAHGSIRNFYISIDVPDTTPPLVSVSIPPDGTAVNSSRISIYGTASDKNLGGSGIDSVTIDSVNVSGGNALSNNTANWSHQVSLVSGVNTFSVAATDSSLANNQTIFLYSLDYYPFKTDSDSDGLDDMFELAIGTAPNSADTDGDGISDKAEISFDGESAYYDYYNDMDPLSNDSDNDGISDGDEIEAGSDPLDARPFPPTGDLNNDGNVDISDLILGNQIILGQYLPTPEQSMAFDLAPILHGVSHPDGFLNAADLLLLQRIILE